MEEITEAQVQEYLAKAEEEKAKKKAEKVLKKAKRKLWIKDHKLTLGAIGVGASLMISKVVKDVLKEMNGNKDAASAADRENAAFCNGYQNGWYDANCAADKDDSTTEVNTTEDAPVE